MNELLNKIIKYIYIYILFVQLWHPVQKSSSHTLHSVLIKLSQPVKATPRTRARARPSMQPKLGQGSLANQPLALSLPLLIPVQRDLPPLWRLMREPLACTGPPVAQPSNNRESRGATLTDHIYRLSQVGRLGRWGPA